MLSPQSTTIPYSPADGLNVPASSGPLAVRNALVVANDEGTEGNFVAAIVNESDSSQVLNLEVGENAVKLTVRVPAGDTVSLGTEDTDPLLIEDLGARPGSTVPIFFQSGDGEGARVEIPVLNGDLDYLTPLVP
ncbi:hypothetical protein GCM10009862_13200 [Microbacterium binotii]|uniref:DNA modification methylase n=2 Tax=Microbacterium binotii TaxID=462710 RepID=A0ABN3P9V8_9MICO